MRSVLIRANLLARRLERVRIRADQGEDDSQDGFHDKSPIVSREVGFLANGNVGELTVKARG